MTTASAKLVPFSTIRFPPSTHGSGWARIGRVVQCVKQRILCRRKRLPLPDSIPLGAPDALLDLILILHRCFSLLGCQALVLLQVKFRSKMPFL